MSPTQRRYTGSETQRKASRARGGKGTPSPAREGAVTTKTITSHGMEKDSIPPHDRIDISRAQRSFDRTET